MFRKIYRHLIKEKIKFTYKNIYSTRVDFLVLHQTHDFDPPTSHTPYQSNCMPIWISQSACTNLTFSWYDIR